MEQIFEQKLIQATQAAEEQVNDDLSMNNFNLTLLFHWLGRC
jgi:hypothetical protein